MLKSVGRVAVFWFKKSETASFSVSGEAQIKKKEGKEKRKEKKRRKELPLAVLQH